jgi:hypothetical protein
MAELPQCAKHILRMDFCADCTFFCGDTPLFAPANADAQNARDIATFAHQIDQPHNPTGSRRSCHTTNMRLFTRQDNQKNRKPRD